MLDNDFHRDAVKINQQLVLLLLFFIPLVINTKMMWPHRAPKELLLQFGSIWIIFTAVISWPEFRQNFIAKFNGIDLSILLYFLFIFTSYLFIPQYKNSTEELILLLCLVILYFMIQGLARGKNFQEKIFAVVLGSGIVLAIYGISQYLGFDPFHPDNYQYYESKVIGTLGNANRVGGFLAAVLPFVWYYLKRNLYKPVYLIIILIILTAVALTLCRGAWIAALGGIVIFFLPEIKTFPLRLSSYRNLLAICTIVILFTLGITFYYIFQINIDSTTGRLFLWKVSFEMTKDFPIFGVGYGNYPLEYLNYQAKFFANPENVKYFERAANIKQAHNQFIQILAETGIPGILFFLSTIGLFFSTSVRLVKLTADIRNLLVIRTLLASVSSILIHCLIDSPLQVLPITIIFFVCLSLMSNLQKKLTKNPKVTPNKLRHKTLYFWLGIFVKEKRLNLKISGLLKVILIFFYLGITVYASINIYHRFQGFVYWKTAQISTNQNQLQESKVQYLKAITKLPGVGELHFNLGGVYTKLQEYKLAIIEFELASKNFNDKNLPISMGVTYEGLNKYIEAEESYMRAIAIYPKLLLPRYLLARLYYKDGKIERSKEMLKEIETIIPGVESSETGSIKNAAKKFLKTINYKQG